MLRIDVPGVDGALVATQFYSGAAIYCITPTTEEMAREVAASNQPAPVHRWELPPTPVREQIDDDDADDLDPDDPY